MDRNDTRSKDLTDFPMIDAFGSIRDWHSSLYRGDEGAINTFLEVIDSALTSGWSRDLDYERTRPWPGLIRCYRFDRASDAAMRVGLDRATPTRVRGGTVQSLRHPPSGDTSRLAQLVAEFSETHVDPSILQTGVHCSWPRFGPRSEVSHVAERMFTRLADLVDGVWPLPAFADGSWDELISVSLAERVAIDPAELSQWAKASGWPDSDVVAFRDRFFADAALLANRLDYIAR